MAPYQEEAGAHELPAQPPVEAGPLPSHLLDVIAELPHACGEVAKQGLRSLWESPRNRSPPIPGSHPPGPAHSVLPRWTSSSGCPLVPSPIPDHEGSS